MATRKPATQITQKELNQAVEKYLLRGGQIMKLPEQKPYSHSRVGERYESSVIDFQISN